MLRIVNIPYIKCRCSCFGVHAMLVLHWMVWKKYLIKIASASQWASSVLIMRDLSMGSHATINPLGTNRHNTGPWQEHGILHTLKSSVCSTRILDNVYMYIYCGACSGWKVYAGLFRGWNWIFGRAYRASGLLHTPPHQTSLSNPVFYSVSGICSIEGVAKRENWAGATRGMECKIHATFDIHKSTVAQVELKWNRQRICCWHFGRLIRGASCVRCAVGLFSNRSARGKKIMTTAESQIASAGFCRKAHMRAYHQHIFVLCVCRASHRVRTLGTQYIVLGWLEINQIERRQHTHTHKLLKRLAKLWNSVTFIRQWVLSRDFASVLRSTIRGILSVHFAWMRCNAFRARPGNFTESHTLQDIHFHCTLSTPVNINRTQNQYKMYLPRTLEFVKSPHSTAHKLWTEYCCCLCSKCEFVCMCGCC